MTRAPARKRRRSRPAKVKWRGIVKVQRSLYSSDAPPGEDVLIYSEDMSVMYQGKTDRYIEAWFQHRGHKYKFFAEAELRGTIINLVRKAPWQDW